MKASPSTIAFIAIGLNHCTKDAKVLDHWDAGFIELMNAAIEYADYVESLYTVGSAFNDVPGVFEYEVCEPFGIWFGQEILECKSGGCAPSATVCRNKLMDLCLDFFCQHGSSAAKRGQLFDLFQGVA